MRHDNYKNHSISLAVGSVLLILTMVLHPAHMDVDMLLLNVISHSLAVFSIPFCLYGFLGLTRSFTDKILQTNLGFSFSAFGLVAGMLAATINGIAATMFYQHNDGPSMEDKQIIHLIFDYSFALNNAVSYVFIGAILIAILFWSWAIVSSSKYQKWTGYLGFAFILGSILAMISGINLMQVWAFRTFIFGMVGWILIMSFKLYQLEPHDE